MFGQSFGRAIGRLSADSEPMPSITLDLTELLSVLKNERRRHVIDLVSEVGDDGIDISELAGCVAARELDKSVDEVEAIERKRVYISLRQLHLEKVEEVGLIEPCDREQEYFSTAETEKASELVSMLRDVTGGGPDDV